MGTIAGLGLAAVLVVGACGGGSGPSGFVEAGNRICREGDIELADAGDDVLDEGSGSLTPAETAEFYLDEVLPIARERLDALSELDAPAGRDDELVDLVAAGRRAVAEIETSLESDPGEFLAASGPNPFSEFDALALSFGLDDCAGRAQEVPESAG